MNTEGYKSVISQLRERIRIQTGDITALQNDLLITNLRLDQYEADATALIEEHGCDPSDKIDREVLKRMLNCLIGENRRLKNAD